MKVIDDDDDDDDDDERKIRKKRSLSQMIDQVMTINSVQKSSKSELSSRFFSRLKILATGLKFCFSLPIIRLKDFSCYQVKRLFLPLSG